MLRSKLPESNKTVLSNIQKYIQQNEVVDLATSLPDCRMPEKLSALIMKYIKEGKNQYAPIEGVLSLRKSVSDYYANNFSKKYNPETEITITNGATEAVWDSITAIVHEDDEVIIIEPSYENYVPAIRLNGGIPVFVTLKPPFYKIDWNEVIRMVSQRTRMIILSTPHIQTGVGYTDEDFKSLSKVISGSKIILLCDDSFKTFVYDNNFLSIAKYPVLTKQTIIVSSLSKELSATGWKTGYCIAPNDYSKEIRKIHNYICNGSNAVFQYAAAEFLNLGTDYFDTLCKEYKQKRDLLCSMLKGSKYKFIPCQSTWFQIVDCSEVSKLSDKDFALELCEKYGVAVFPMSVYYHDKTKSNIVRICFARSIKTIEKGVKCLLNAQK